MSPELITAIPDLTHFGVGEGLPTTRSLRRSRDVFCSNQQLSMSVSTPSRSLTSSLLKGAAYLFGVTAGLLFFVGGRALHEFGKFDRMFGEMTSMVVAVVLGAVAVLLRGLAERIEAHDDGEPVRLAIGDGKE